MGNSGDVKMYSPIWYLNRYCYIAHPEGDSGYYIFYYGLPGYPGKRTPITTTQALDLITDNHMSTSFKHLENKS